MEIYCDCSFDEKRKIAGIGLLVKEGARQNAISHWIPAPNNNYGELWAIYQASILMHGKHGTIYTDSQTALLYLHDQVKDKPRTREQWENHQRMRLLGYQIRRLNPNVQWVKGHVHTFGKNAVDNSIADILAKQGRSKFYLTIRENKR